jgi:hypothetical protein
LRTRYKAYSICCNLQRRLCEEFTPNDDDDGEDDGDVGMPQFDEPYTQLRAEMIAAGKEELVKVSQSVNTLRRWYRCVLVQRSVRACDCSALTCVACSVPLPA